MIRALVVGAAGFVGAALAHRLLDDGHDVHLLVRPGSDAWRLTGLSSPVHETDIRSRDAVATLLARLRPEWVFHAAAHGAYAHQSDWRRMVATNVLGLRHVLESSFRAGAGTLVHTGSSSEYGFTDHAPGEDEAGRPNSDYGITKLAATRLCRAFARRRGARAVTLRLYSVYGPWEEPSRLVPALALQGLGGSLPPLVSPNVARDFVYVDDVVDACLAAVTARELEPGAIYNVGTGRQLTIREAVAIARRELAIPERPRFGTMPDRAWDTRTWVADPGKIGRELGLRDWIPFERGFARFVSWLRDDPARLEVYRRRLAARDR